MRLRFDGQQQANPANREHQDRPKIAQYGAEDVAHVVVPDEPVKVRKPGTKDGVPHRQQQRNNVVPEWGVAKTYFSPFVPSHHFDGSRYHPKPQGEATDGD